ncbi:MAG: hypothetical protein CMH62_03760 [Nanoarchaeota archaeon]|nr:hypothetical protein [Nanoarchaeota archaeon]
MPQIVKMWKNKSCKDVSLFMLLLQVVGYFSGVMFLIKEGIENLLLSFNYYSGLFIAIITTIGWILCDRCDKRKEKEINKSKRIT